MLKRDDCRCIHSNHSLGRWFSLLFYIFAMYFFILSPAKSMEHMAQADKEPESKVTVKPVVTTQAIRLSDALTLETLIPELATKRVVYVGETHNRFDHHLIQLEVVRRLHALHPELAIGMEFFQQPFQQHLDDYIRGDIDEREMLRRTEYYERWRYDYRFYAPILRYAREQDIPIIALNIPTELTQKVARGGLENLNDEERAQLPDDIDRSDKAYAKRLENVFKHHPEGQASKFDYFLTSQLLWDEGMAEQIADYLSAHPATHMVVLAGSGHLAFGSGIPNRVARRLPLDSSIILNNWEGPLEPGVADVLLLPQEKVIPKAGKIGAILDENKEKGILKVESCVPESPCEQAGLKSGDQILSINGETINSMADLRIMMWDRQPGEEISLSIRRKPWFGSTKELSYQITLQ